MRTRQTIRTLVRMTEPFGQRLGPALAIFALATLLLASLPAMAQMPGGPPSVGVVKAKPTAITETSEFIGRVQATDRVALTARVTAFLDQRFFTEGSEVQKGDLLYQLEQAPFQAVLQQQEAAVADATAKLSNANITLARAQSLLNGPAGQRSTVDDAIAAQRSAAAQVQSAQAQLKTAQINLDYTQIHAPISGKISRTTITIGNVVSPSSGALATIVSQDPMYVVFPVASRVQTDLEKRYADKGGMNAVVVKLRLANGQIYNQTGKIDYIDPSVSGTTDTILMRARIANPPLRPADKGQADKGPADKGPADKGPADKGQPDKGHAIERALVDNAFVTVMVEGIEPVMALGIPRKAVLSDQQGDYVYVVGADKKAEVRRIQLGQSTPTTAVIAGGLKEGETVIAEGIQRVRPGIAVNPGPMSPQPTTGQ